jgi:hypothetical protein
MWFTPRLIDRHSSARKHARRSPVKPRAFHPRSELLEGRALLSTLTVTNTRDSGKSSLRYAIAQAENDLANDAIVFNISKKDKGYNSSTGIWTITLTSGELDITTGLTIEGPGAGQLTISGGNQFRVFEVNARDPVFLSGLTVSNGNGMVYTGLSQYHGDGGGILNLSTLTLIGCVVSGNDAFAGGGTNYGGGICNAGNLTISGCTVSNNYAEGANTNFDSGFGGGIYNAGTLTVSNSTLSGNDAQLGDGGGIYNAGTLTVTGSTVSGNFADSTGGGIYNAGTLTVSNSNFSRNLEYADTDAFTENNIYGPYTDLGGNSFS